MVGHRLAHLGGTQALVLAAVAVAAGASLGWSLLGLPGPLGAVFLASLAVAAVLGWPVVGAVYPETADDRG